MTTGAGWVVAGAGHGTVRARLLPVLGVLALLLVAGPVSLAAGDGGQEPSAEATDLQHRVQEILRRVPLIDGHNDAPMVIRHRASNRLEEFDFSDTTGLDRPMHTDLRRLREGGVGGQLWSVWVSPELQAPQAVTVLIEQIDLVHRLVELYPEQLELALTAADVERIHADGRIACLIGMEGSHSVGDSLAVLRQAYLLGARYLTLTHWKATAWADSATSAPLHDGLSEAGEHAVREMNRLGMMVDLSHVSRATMHDALNVSAAPVIFSHSNTAALNGHPRNVPDDVLERLPANGGIVMVNFSSFFVSPEVVSFVAARSAEKERLETIFPGSPDVVEQRLGAWLDDHPVPRVTIAQLVDHMELVRDLAGIEHLGIGSDFDGIRATPEGLDDVTGYPVLLAELLRRGWSDDDVAAVAGANLLRVMRRVEQVAAGLRSTTHSQDPLELLVAAD